MNCAILDVNEPFSGFGESLSFISFANSSQLMPLLLHLGRLPNMDWWFTRELMVM